MDNHEYTFNARLFAAFTVRAATVAEARAKLAAILDWGYITVTADRDGETVTGEASLDDGGLDLIEIDGEAADGEEG